MRQSVQNFTQKFLSIAQENKPIRIISHFDTDGITSASILAKVFSRLDKKFTLRIVKGLTQEILTEELKRNDREILMFSDLASGSLEYFQDLKNEIFIFDHHEIHSEKLNPKINILNPHLTSDPNANDCS